MRYKMDGFELAMKIIIIMLKIVCGIFIGAIVLPLKLLESRVETEGDFIEVNFNEDEL